MRASLVAQMVKNLLVTWDTWVRDMDSMPGFGRSPRGGHGNPLRCSCLENPWSEDLVGYSPWGHKESDTTRRLNNTMLGDTECWSCPPGIRCQNSCLHTVPGLLRGASSSLCLEGLDVASEQQRAVWGCSFILGPL